MQVRVLRHAQPGSSVYGWIEPENSGPAGGLTRGPWAHFRGHIFDPLIPVGDIQVPANATVVIRSIPVGDTPAWLPGPRSEFLDWCYRLEAAVPNPLCIWPTAAGTVSDVPSLRTFLAGAEQRGRPWTFLFDPVSLLTPSMFASADDHLSRAFESLADHASRGATLLADGAVVGDEVVPTPLGSGALTGLVLHFATPRPAGLVLLEESLEQQLALL